MYLITSGVAPWIEQKLMNQVSASPYFNVSFYDSHNYVLEMEQMNFQVRFGVSRLIFLVRYLGSQFQDSTTADALWEELFKGLPLSPTIDKMTQLAMDGINADWLIWKKMSECREKYMQPM